MKKLTTTRVTTSLAAVALALGGTAVAAAPALAAEGPVTIPSNYVYNPAGPDKTLHDYCSYSPDSWGSADFRGPCARHDLCIEYAQKARSGCDSDLLANLKQECRYAYGTSWKKTACYGIAEVYYAAVSAKTAIGSSMPPSDGRG